MTDTLARRVVLDLATEDSYAPSEIVTRLRAAYPQYSLAEARTLARRIVNELVDLGLIEATWLEKPGGSEDALELDVAKAALADDLAWLPHKHWRPHVRISATHAGQEARRKWEVGV